jgi:site-specific recombinase XerD
MSHLLPAALPPAAIAIGDTRLTLPALVTAAGDQAQRCFLEFFTATIRNPHTRRAYGRAVDEFLLWCSAAGVPSLTAVRPLHVATWIEAQSRMLAAPTVKQQLAAIRHLFDRLVTGQVMPIDSFDFYRRTTDQLASSPEGVSAKVTTTVRTKSLARLRNAARS